MNKRIISLMLLIVLSTTFVFPIKTTNGNMSGYMSDILSSVQELSPKVYQGQQRTYLMGGSVSLRSTANTQPFITSTPPRIKAGCGGIDIVMGGFSFLNFEYLVQKLQGILQAAPAFAFRLALKTLAPEVDDIIASLEAIADMINSINVDNCQAAKALVGYAGEMMGLTATDKMNRGAIGAFFSSIKETTQRARDSVKQFFSDTSQGSYSYYACIGGGGTPEQCATKHQTINFTVPLLTGIFETMTDDTFKQFEPVFRAYWGDVWQEDPDTASLRDEDVPKILDDPGCEKGETDSILKTLVTGLGYRKVNVSSNEQYCERLTPEGQGLAYKVKQALIEIKNSIKNRTAMSPGNIQLISASRYPIYRIMSLAVLYEKLEGDTTGLFSDVVLENIAEPLAYDIASVLLNKLNSSISRASRAQMVKKSSGEVPIPDGVKDYLSLLSLLIKEEIKNSDEIVHKKWSQLVETIGKSYELEARMTKAIYTHLAKTKLLDSYQFAKGIR